MSDCRCLLGRLLVDFNRSMNVRRMRTLQIERRGCCNSSAREHGENLDDKTVRRIYGVRSFTRLIARRVCSRESNAR